MFAYCRVHMWFVQKVRWWLEVLCTNIGAYPIMIVEWEGEDSDGDLWEESWVSVTYLTADLRAEARRLEAELFGPRATQAGHTSRRANHRDDARRRQERERAAQQWRARLRDRAPSSSA
jgi:hypothetical protein